MNTYVKLRRLHQVAGGERFEHVLVVAVVARHVRACAAHVEADDCLLLLLVIGRDRVADDAASRTAKNSLASTEAFRVFKKLQI